MNELESVKCEECSFRKAVVEAKHLDREAVEDTVKAVIKEYFGYKDIIMPIYNMSKGNLYKLLADKICELVVDEEQLQMLDDYKNDCEQLQQRIKELEEKLIRTKADAVHQRNEKLKYIGYFGKHCKEVKQLKAKLKEAETQNEISNKIIANDYDDNKKLESEIAKLQKDLKDALEDREALIEQASLKYGAIYYRDLADKYKQKIAELEKELCEANQDNEELSRMIAIQTTNDFKRSEQESESDGR